MELRNLKTFIRAAELGSFSAAAERLNYAQSTVTAQIESLERELSVSLFIRTGKRITLSAAGKELLAYACEMRDLEEKIKSHFTEGGEPAGELRLGFLESICASPYMEGISEFLEKYPKVRLKVTVGTTLQLIDMLKRGEVDAAVLLDKPVTEPEIRILYKRPSRIVFFAAAGGKFSGRGPVRLAELTGENWLLTERGCNYRKLLEDELAKRGLTLSDRLEIGSTAALIRLAAGGAGISLLPEFDLKEELAAGRVSEIPVEDCAMEMDIQILVSAERLLSPAMSRLCGEIAGKFDGE